MQAKDRTESKTNVQFQLKSVVFERDNLEMELAESLKQIDRLEQLNKSAMNASMIEMGANTDDLKRELRTESSMQV